MLVLIVVAAVTAFAAFEQTYQKQYQSQQSVIQQRNLEKIVVLSVAAHTDDNVSSPSQLGVLVFSLASLSVNPSRISGVLINANAVETYGANVTNDNGTISNYTVSGPTALLFLPAHAQFNITVNVAPGKQDSLYDKILPIDSSSYLKIDLETVLENDFFQTFVPPTAVATVDALQIYTTTGPVTVPEFDGSHSLQSGNDTIVSWTWSIFNQTANSTLPSVSGEDIVPQFASGGAGPATPAATYVVTLTVTDSAGLVGVTTFTYKY